MKKILLTLIISCVFANLIWATSENTKNGSDKNTIYSYITKAQSTIKEALSKSDLQTIQELAYKAKRFSYSAQCEADECDYDTARMHYKKAITESPILEVFAILGWSRMERRIKNVDAALEVLSLKPSNEPRIKLEKVKCLYLQDRLIEARELLDTINHNTQDDFFNRSVILEYARLEKIEGTYESAIKYVEKAKQGPKDFVYIQALYEETKLNIKYGDYKKSSECIDNNAYEYKIIYRSNYKIFTRRFIIFT